MTEEKLLDLTSEYITFNGLFRNVNTPEEFAQLHHSVYTSLKNTFEELENK